jgi:hypothetical protein
MRRARLTVVGSGLAVVLVLAASGSASGQDGDTSTTTAPSESTTTTSTTAPPVTVVLDGGDIGILPPGSGDPSAPPPPGEPGAPGDPSAPDDGELAVPPELAVVVLPDPTPGLNAALADIDVTRARTALAAAEGTRRSADIAVAEAFGARATALAARRDAGRHVRAARDIVDALAINALIYGDIAGIEPVVGPPSLDDLRDLELSDVAAEKVYADLAGARKGYRKAVAAELEATEHLVRVQQVARFIHGEYLGLRQDLAKALRDAAEARRQLGPSILGPAFLETPDLVAWYRTYYPVDPPVAPIVDIIDAYLRVGAEEGVRGDIAFAQAILETGGFRSGHAQGFNFAGIGAYDGCAPVCGFRFRDLDAGVRAHLHLLRAYADPGLTSAQLAAPPDPKVAPERVGVRGCCARWTELTGVWATDLNYDRKILGIYRLMVETARQLDRAQA